MKDFKSMMIGFLLASCMFLMLGATNNNSQIGRYQLNGSYLLDTTNGDEYLVQENTKGIKHWEKHIIGIKNN